MVPPPIEEARQAFADPSRPLPSFVWLVLTVLVSFVLFLGLRLAVVRWSAGPAAAPPSPAAAAQLQTARILRPSPPKAAGELPVSEEHFRQLVEGWRQAWMAKDLRRYLGYYSRSFGAQGRDLAEWARQRSRAFAVKAPIEIEVRALRASVRQSIAIVSFAQVYRSGGHEERGVKTLHLLPEDGEWRIFNESWSPADGERSGGAVDGEAEQAR